jgi:hypothetical protein
VPLYVYGLVGGRLDDADVNSFLLRVMLRSLRRSRGLGRMWVFSFS